MTREQILVNRWSTKFENTFQVWCIRRLFRDLSAWAKRQALVNRLSNTSPMEWARQLTERLPKNLCNANPASSNLSTPPLRSSWVFTRHKNPLVAQNKDICYYNRSIVLPRR